VLPAQKPLHPTQPTSPSGSPSAGKPLPALESTRHRELQGFRGFRVCAKPSAAGDVEGLGLLVALGRSPQLTGNRQRNRAQERQAERVRCKQASHREPPSETCNINIVLRYNHL
jgi:hypothetical protein